MTETAAPAARRHIWDHAEDLAQARAVRQALPVTDPASAGCLYQFHLGHRCALEHLHLADQHVAIGASASGGWLVTMVADVADSYARAAARAAAQAGPAQDMADRLVPTRDQQWAAAALFRALPGVDTVVVALALPGKTRGVWTTGQPVVAVPGVWAALEGHEDGPWSYSTARHAATQAAVAQLNPGEGCTAFVRIDQDGTYAVFAD